MTELVKDIANASSDAEKADKTDEQRQIGLKIPEELLLKCDLAAKKLGLTRSGVIKLAIARFVEQENL
jgi:metal-responsive CopG/Arc/MetJ family transcriptional regulator